MKNDTYNLIGSDFKNISEVPKDDDIFYRCKKCNSIIPSVPADNIGCDCGNVFIDRDSWRLIVVDISKLEVLKKI